MRDDEGLSQPLSTPQLPTDGNIKIHHRKDIGKSGGKLSSKSPNIFWKSLTTGGKDPSSGRGWDGRDSPSGGSPWTDISSGLLSPCNGCGGYTAGLEDPGEQLPSSPFVSAASVSDSDPIRDSSSSCLGASTDVSAGLTVSNRSSNKGCRIDIEENFLETTCDKLFLLMASAFGGEGLEKNTISNVEIGPIRCIHGTCCLFH